MKASSIQPLRPGSTIDINVQGKQHGHLTLPCATERSAFGTIQIPVCVIRNGDGPVVTLLAGSHGDEYDGQVALHNLASSIQVEDISGCLIIAPMINALATSKHTRLSAVDGKDLDTCFPGNESGSPTEQIAAHLFNTLVVPADLVIEIQSGGTTTLFTSLAAVHFDSQNKPLQDRSEQHMVAFGAPYSARLLPCQSGSLAASVQQAHKEFLAVRLGGGGSVSARNLGIALIGCRNVLVQLGVLNHELVLRSTRMLEVSSDKNHVIAPCSGLLDMCKDAGDEVYLGSPVAKIIRPGSTGVAAVIIKADRNGIIMARHHSGFVDQGDCVAIVADEVQR